MQAASKILVWWFSCSFYGFKHL